MADLDHSWIDILKMDIEMHEWGLFLEYYKEHPGAKLPATQLLVEFHFPGEAAKVWEVLDLITADNYRVFSVEVRQEYSCGHCLALSGSCTSLPHAHANLCLLFAAQLVLQ